ncbi:hypothetical protein [uncultured Sulfitobacter sp.]|uniref:hypothetical protein n=1 Tax=uncultured Sulfitobacter sp. TaxID=191468 RepID=UPI00262C9D31|nr:hypothetical protein [uncultured Sulfitobacter sp.]
MRTIVSTLALAFVSLALVLSGPASRGIAVADATLVELCLDGVVQAVRLGRDGQPVTPDQQCGDSHACCIVSADPALRDGVPDLSAMFLEQATAPGATDIVILRIEYLSADPRGPPAVRTGQIDQTEIRS